MATACNGNLVANFSFTGLDAYLAYRKRTCSDLSRYHADNTASGPVMVDHNMGKSTTKNMGANMDFPVAEDHMGISAFTDRANWLPGHSGVERCIAARDFMVD